MTETIRQDQRLVEALQRGEESAVEEFVDRYGAWIHWLAGRLLADQGEAEEVSLESFLPSSSSRLADQLV